MTKLGGGGNQELPNKKTKHCDLLNNCDCLRKLIVKWVIVANPGFSRGCAKSKGERLFTRNEI